MYIILKSQRLLLTRQTWLGFCALCFCLPTKIQRGFISNQSNVSTIKRMTGAQVSENKHEGPFLEGPDLKRFQAQKAITKILNLMFIELFFSNNFITNKVNFHAKLMPIPDFFLRYRSLKMALQAQLVIGSFEKRAPGLNGKSLILNAFHRIYFSRLFSFLFSFFFPSSFQYLVVYYFYKLLYKKDCHENSRVK